MAVRLTPRHRDRWIDTVARGMAALKRQQPKRDRLINSEMNRHTNKCLIGGKPTHHL